MAGKNCFSSTYLGRFIATSGCHMVFSGAPSGSPSLIPSPFTSLGLGTGPQFSEPLPVAGEDSQSAAAHMFSWNVIGIHWARLSRAPSVQMLVCQEEGQAVIDAIMAFAIVNIALTVPGRRIHQRIVGEFCVFL